MTDTLDRAVPGPGAVCRRRRPFAAARSRVGPAPTDSPFTGPLPDAKLKPTLVLGPSHAAPHVLKQVCLPSTPVVRALTFQNR